MTLTMTLSLMAASASLFALSAWRSGKPAKPGQVRMIPWVMIAILSGAFFMLVAAHLFTLFGFETGQMFSRR